MHQYRGIGSERIDKVGADMKRYSIPRRYKTDIERVLMRYPETKRDYENRYKIVVLSRTSIDDVKGNISSDNKPQSVTEGSALKLMTDLSLKRMKVEIDAVESALDGLDEVKMSIISQRFWTKRKEHKKVPLSRIVAPYSYDAIGDICRLVTYRIGNNLGYIEKGE